MASPTDLTVLFVCQHGSAKSIVAARHFERLAALHGSTVHCLSAGLEPDEAIPPHVVNGLKTDGLDASGKPRELTRELINQATHIVTFGCALEPLDHFSGVAVSWDGVPAVSDGYAPARDAIVARLPSLLETIVAESARD